jgi:hypothetical protein
MRNKTKQGNMMPQKVSNHTIEDLVDSEGDESSVAEVRRMITIMFKELKKDLQNQLNESQENTEETETTK